MIYKGIIRKRLLEVVITLAISIMLLIVIFKCSEVPVHTTDLRNNEMKDSTQFLLESYPYSIINLFSLHDISKEEYVYLLPQSFGGKMYAFMRNYEGAEWSETGHFISVKDYSHLLVVPDSPEITFYTKLILSENLQSIRTFFLTEIFAFFIAVLGFNLYRFFQCYYRRKHGKSYIFKRTQHLKYLFIYALLSIFVLVFIVIICKSPTKIINTCDYHEDTNSVFFKPYDISQTYYKMDVAPTAFNGDTIKWSSKEIVEFSSMQKSSKIKSSKSLVFVNFDKNKPFKNDFYTKNLVSKNLQDIRLFLLTTIFLLFFARICVHLKLFILYPKSKVSSNRGKRKNK